jgi:hypothetical protein
MTKIPGVVILFSILIFHCQNIKAGEGQGKFIARFIDRRIIFFCIFFAGFYILGNPGIIRALRGVIHWAFSFVEVTGSAQFRPEFPQPQPVEPLFLYYFNVIFPTRYLILNIFSWGGIIISFHRRMWRTLPLAVFVAIYLALLSRSKDVELIYPRYILPLLPFFFVYAGIFIDFLVKLPVPSEKFKKVVIGVFVAISFYLPLKDTMAFDRKLGLTDTRTLAEAWADKNIDVTDKIIIEGSLYKASTISIPLKMKPELVDEAMSEYFQNNDPTEAKSNFYKILKKSLRDRKTYHLILTGNRDQLQQTLRQKDVDFIILRDKTMAAMNTKANLKLFPELAQVVAWAASDDFVLVKKFAANDETKGPTLLVYKRRKS